MIDIKYPRYIDKIGIEFEGLYHHDLQYEERQKSDWNDDFFQLYADNKLFIAYDSSVHYDDRDNEEDNFTPYEVTTKPCNQEELNEILNAYNKWYKQDLYRLNYSTGLHFHISLKKGGFGSVCNIKFYMDMYNLFKNKYPKIWEERENNQYCYADIQHNYGQRTREYKPEQHFTKRSQDTGSRYHIVNYSNEEHNGKRAETIEIRFYGGSHATITGLAEVIQDTIKIIGKYYKEKQVVEQIIDTPLVCRIVPTEVKPLIRHSKRIAWKHELIIKPDNKTKQSQYIFKKEVQQPLMTINEVNTKIEYNERTHQYEKVKIKIEPMEINLEKRQYEYAVRDENGNVTKYEISTNPPPLDITYPVNHSQNIINL